MNFLKFINFKNLKKKDKKKGDVSQWKFYRIFLQEAILPPNRVANLAFI